MGMLNIIVTEILTDKSVLLGAGVVLTTVGRSGGLNVVFQASDENGEVLFASSIAFTTK